MTSPSTSPATLTTNSWRLGLEKVGTKGGNIVQLDVQNSDMQAGDTLMICLVYDGLLSIKDGRHCEVFE